MRNLILAVACASQLAAQPSDTSAERARAVVMRHMQAIGGLDAYSGIRSTHMVLEMHLARAGLDLRIETWGTKPNLLYMMSRSTAGTAEGGFDGEVGWMRGEGEGAKLLPRPPQNGWTPFDPYDALARYEVKYLGPRERGGRRMEALQMLDPDGTAYTSYFDAETGLLSRLDISNPASPATTMIFEQYKRFGALLYPTRLTTRIAELEPAVARVLGVDHRPIDPKRYELPKDVRELASRRP